MIRRVRTLSLTLALLVWLPAIPAIAADATDGDFVAAILVEAESGEVLFANHEHDRRPPASMVKMMTELIVLELVGQGDVGMDDPVRVSAHSSTMGGSQVYLKEGEVFSVREMLMALSIHSANDAAVALAEHVAGSVTAFVEIMNTRAAELGMDDTEFHSVHGLPPDYGQSSDLSSAHDMALLGRELCLHPEALEWAVMDQVPFRNGEFLLTNPNPLVGEYRGLDGLKTGFHSRAGYCLTATAVQKGIRLISVVMGASTNENRGLETTRLLSRGFNSYTRLTLVAAAGDPSGKRAKLRGGKIDRLPLIYAAPFTVTVPKDRVDEVVFSHRVRKGLKAPVKRGQAVGRAVALLDGRLLGEVPLQAAESVEKQGFWGRLFGR